jgi:hypothetical protein
MRSAASTARGARSVVEQRRPFQSVAEDLGHMGRAVRPGQLNRIVDPVLLERQGECRRERARRAPEGPQAVPFHRRDRERQHVEPRQQGDHQPRDHSHAGD